MNKTVQDLKMEIEAIKKTQTQGILEIKILGKRTENIDISITNRMEKVKDRISDIEDTIEESDTSVK